jgi:hypothetical protein
MADTYLSVGMYVKPALDRDQWRRSSSAAIVTSRSAEERVSVQKVTRRRTDRRLHVPALWRSFILLLVLAFAASGLHVTSGGHAAGAAIHAHFASVDDASSGGEACCHDADGQAHEPVCGMAAGCSLCVPVGSADLLVRPDADRAEMEPTGRHSGLIQPPQIRPPKLTATV